MNSMPTVAENTQLLMRAAERGDANEVQRLIPLSDPKALNSQALCSAAINGYAQCIELLIPVSDPKDRNSHALQLAVQYNNEKSIELLYDVSDPLKALEAPHVRYPSQTEKWIALENFEAKRLRGVLSKEVGEGVPVRKHKM